MLFQAQEEEGATQVVGIKRAERKVASHSFWAPFPRQVSVL